jgi:sugar lactone lactonase YvrE
MQELANGLLFPEGPTWLGDGSLIVVEIAAGRLTRIEQDIYPLEMPNGIALSPDEKTLVLVDTGRQARDGAQRRPGTDCRHGTDRAGWSHREHRRKPCNRFT